MSSLNFDQPQLDYTTRFSFWQVNMRAILVQTSDLYEVWVGFGKNNAKKWTSEEKQKDRKDLSFIEIYLSSNILQEVLLVKTASTLWLKLE
jgi:hypothetical protein